MKVMADDQPLFPPAPPASVSPPRRTPGISVVSIGSTINDSSFNEAGQKHVHNNTAPDTFEFASRHSFSSISEYTTTWRVHILSEKKAERDLCNDLSTEHRVVLQEVPQSNDRAFFAYLKLPVELRRFCIVEGTRVAFDFGETDLALKPTIWYAHAIAPEHGPLDYATFVMRRPWDRQHRLCYGTVPEKLPPAENAHANHAAIARASGILVSVVLESSDRVHLNLIRALDHMLHPPKNHVRTEWNVQTQQALLGNDFNLPAKDIFAAVRQEFPDVTLKMTLNDSQRVAIKGMQQAPAGLVIINGSRGTDMTQFPQEIVKPFLYSGKTHSVLIASHSNSAVNRIADRMDTLLTDLKTTQDVAEAKYGLRAHSKGTETAIRKQWIAGQQGPDPAAHPTVWDTEPVIEDLDEVSRLLVQTFQVVTRQSVAGINDPRLQHPHLSISMKMLEISGVIESVYTVADPMMFASFRDYTQRMADGEWFDKDQLRAYNQYANRLWDYTVRNASFIVGTISNMCSFRMLERLSEHTRLIMIDDAAQEREDHLLPFFAANFTKLDGFVQIGDQSRGSPVVTTGRDQDLFSAQGSVSLMARMIFAGFPAVYEWAGQ